MTDRSPGETLQLVIEALDSATVAPDRREAGQLAIDAGIAASLLTCTRCELTRDVLGMVRHLNVVEAEHTLDGGRASYHQPGDLRGATELERLAFEDERRRW